MVTCVTNGSISPPTCHSHLFTVLPYSTFFAMIDLTFPFTSFGLFFLYFLVEQWSSGNNSISILKWGKGRF